MKIEGGIITVESLPYFFNKEKRGVKPNTVRLFTEDELAQIRYRKPKKIHIELSLSNGETFFERKITDFTALGDLLGLSLVDISWKHSEKLSAEEAEE